MTNEGGSPPPFLTPRDCAAPFTEGRPRRIHVIGTGGGLGKTTFARRLGAQLDIPVHDLDAVAYEGAYEGRPGIKRPLEDRLRDIFSITRQPAWLSEGCYLWWIDQLLERADLIVWLDLHWTIATWRVVKREGRRWLAREKMHGGILDYLDFLRGGRSDYLNTTPRIPTAPDDDSAITRAGMVVELAKHRDKTVRCASRRDVKALLDALTKTQGSG